MVDDFNPFVPPDEKKVPEKAAADRSRSIVFGWILYYFLTAVVLLLTAPVTSKSYPWSGFTPAFFTVMFGAFRLGRRGASASTAFIYGCGSSTFFLQRFTYSLESRSWLGPGYYSDLGMAIILISICLFLGCAAAATTKAARRIPSP